MGSAPTQPLPHTDPVAARLVGLLAAEISGPMTDALARVSGLARDGQIDRDGLQALAKDIALTRQAGLTGQRIARLAAGLGQQPREPVDLAAVASQVMAELKVEPAHALLVDATRPPVRVLGDPALLHTLIEAATHWAIDRARSPLQWTLRLEAWPARARLACHFDREEAPAQSSADLDPSLEGLLMRYAAHAAGASLHIGHDGMRTRLELRFMQLVNDALAGVCTVELDAPGSSDSPLAGCQLLVLGHKRALRQRVRLALHAQDVFVDFASSIELAAAYCEEGLPQVLLYESTFEGPALNDLRKRLLATDPPVALIELTPDAAEVQRGGLAVRLGVETIEEQLATLLWMEMQQLVATPPPAALASAPDTPANDQPSTAPG